MRHRGGLIPTVEDLARRARLRIRNAAMEAIADRGLVAAACGSCDTVAEFYLEKDAEDWLLNIHPQSCPGRAVH